MSCNRYAAPPPVPSFELGSDEARRGSALSSVVPLSRQSGKTSSPRAFRGFNLFSHTVARATLAPAYEC